MQNFLKLPEVKEVKIKDRFWTPYIDNVRRIMIPYCFDKFEETRYIENFRNVGENNGKGHFGHTFSDGLVFETLTGACGFLNTEYDGELDKKLDDLIELIASAQQEDGYLHTVVCQEYPERKWGEGEEGDIVHQHDLYNQGALIEAAVAHYKATKKTTLLEVAVKCANNICGYVGETPKHNIIPGHSLPEMAFVKLYELFKNTPELVEFSQENNVKIEEYLEIVRFWYDNRGNYKDRNLGTLIKTGRFNTDYNQDSMPFNQMRTAVGHAVRAGLCYQGAAAARRVLNRDDYETALNAIWDDVIKKKIHISGGIGACHDHEGFDSEYLLPNNAYLETCAGISLAFWAGEMNLISKKAEYYDVFELTLYNNILGALGKDFKKFYYDNALINDGTKNRWEWHDCPCCPPMLSKIYSSLCRYIYSYDENELCINMYIGSELKVEGFKVTQEDKKFKVIVENGEKKLSFRIPAYGKDFALLLNGEKTKLMLENGYATLLVGEGEWEIEAVFDLKIAEICANSNVEDDKGMVCVMQGPYLMCAEGIDNDGNIDFVISEKSDVTLRDGRIIMQDADGKDVVLIKYWQRNNRVSDNPNDSKMAVWFKKENMKDDGITGENLYGYYKIHK